MLLELAIGDAYGADFEYVDTEMIRQQNTLSGYVKHPRHHIQPGIHLLDTQLMAFFRTIHSTDKRENSLVDDGNSFFR